VIVQITPLYRGIDLIRSLTIGTVGPNVLVDLGYLVVLGIAGVLLAGARIRRKLLK